MMIIHKIPYNKDHQNYCFHEYKITRVVMDHPEGGVVVLGNDRKFHVVHKDCVKKRKREIALSTKRRNK